MNRKLVYSNPAFRFVLLIVFFVGLALLSRFFHFDIEKCKTWLAHFPLFVYGGCFIAIYVGLTMFLWFGTIDFFRITGAILFGPFWSTLFVYIAEVCNAMILFLISRRLGQEFVVEKFHLKPRDLETPQRNTGFWAAFALRINPFVPFRFMDVGFGLTRLPLRKYFLAVVFGSPLRIFWLQFILAGIGEAIFKNPLAMVDYLKTHPVAMLISFVYFLAIGIVTVTAFIIAATKRR